jgi:hypothetical protein
MQFLKRLTQYMTSTTISFGMRYRLDDNRGTLQGALSNKLLPPALTEAPERISLALDQAPSFGPDGYTLVQFRPAVAPLTQDYAAQLQLESQLIQLAHEVVIQDVLPMSNASIKDRSPIHIEVVSYDLNEPPKMSESRVRLDVVTGANATEARRLVGNPLYQATAGVHASNAQVGPHVNITQYVTARIARLQTLPNPTTQPLVRRVK